MKVGDLVKVRWRKMWNGQSIKFRADRLIVAVC